MASASDRAGAMLPLEARAISVRFDGHTALDDVSFALDGAMPTVILGANGAGKSVLLRVLHGLIAPTSGAVTWAGSAERPRAQAMVFQRPVVLRRSAIANIEYALAVNGIDASERTSRAFAALERVGLMHLADRQARVLSGGEQQRLALARAAALEPRVLFLDEPTASLDPSASAEVERTMGEIGRGGTALVFTTHNLGFAKRIAGEILFLHRGRLVERAAADTFFNHPRSPEAAAFLEGELPWSVSSPRLSHARVAASFAAALLFTLSAQAQDFITVASTTSTEQSGLFKHLLPEAKKALGFDVRVVAVGTGQALDMGRKGDADVVFVHDKVAEQKFLDEGFGVKRYEVMYNDFIIVGPKADPAQTRGKDVEAALKKIAAQQAPFASRADKSGTHAAELRYWKAAGIDQPKGAWYLETGSGMGPTLNTASGKNAYALTDRGTWLSFKNRGDLVILVEGDVKLFNQYGVMLVNPAKHPHVKKDMGQKFIDWVISPAGQAAIAAYKIDGEQLFFPNYKP